MTSSVLPLPGKKFWIQSLVYCFIIKLHICYAEVRVYVSWYMEPRNAPQGILQNKLAELLLIVEDI